MTDKLKRAVSKLGMFGGRPSQKQAFVAVSEIKPLLKDIAAALEEIDGRLKMLEK